MNIHFRPPCRRGTIITLLFILGWMALIAWTLWDIQ